jgi:hypothetical protein
MELMTDRIRAALSQMQPQGAPAGMTPPPGEAGQEPITVQQVEQDVARIAQENPEVIQQIQQEMAMAMNSGELTPEELNMVSQLARAALQNPEVYPQLRSFAIQQGIGTEEDIPVEFDQGLLAAVVMVAQVMQQSAPAGGQAQAPAQGAAPAAGIPTFKEGGPVQAKQPGGAVMAQVHDGEFVIPADVVRRIGEEKLEKLVDSARNPKQKAGLSNSGSVPSAMA